MSGISRIELHKSKEIPASAKDVWALLTDWAGMRRWWLSAEHGGLPGPTLAACDLIGEPNNIPRTRRMILDTGAAVEEELFYQNDQTRRIYYKKSDAAGVSGYIASSYIDEIGDRSCILHISSWFDVRPEADATTAVARFEAVYRAIFNGFRKYFST